MVCDLQSVCAPRYPSLPILTSLHGRRPWGVSPILGKGRGQPGGMAPLRIEAKTSGCLRSTMRAGGNVLRATRRIFVAVLVAASCSDRAIGADRVAIARGVCESEMARASMRFQIPLAVLYAVALTETGRRDGLKPLALNIEGASRYPNDLTEALRIVREAQRSSVTLIDVGCMQINMKFHRERFASLEEMFDPRRNVEYGASYLRTLYVREANWTRAVARYHAGPGNLPAQHRYVCTVIRNMIAAGMGGWTPSSRRFCR